MPHRQAEIQERTRIARELHDTVLQSFTAATLLLQAVANDLRRTDSPNVVAAAGSLDEIIGLTSGALTAGRRAVMNLRDVVLHDASLAVRLESLLHEVLDSSMISFRLLPGGVARRLTEDAELQVMRICREALWNVVRHAEAREVSLALAYEMACLRVTIADDGRGFCVEPRFDARSGHFGLLGMHERAMQAHGDLAIRSAEGHGTAVVLTVPYADSPRELCVA